MIDLYLRRIIGWAMSDRNNTKLVSDALIMTKYRRGKLTDVIVHLDQGITYVSSDYRKLLKENNMLCSMNWKGECLNNTDAESFFSTSK